MVTVVSSNLLVFSRILEAARRMGIELNTQADAPDNFYIIDCNQPEGLETAWKVRLANPHATVVCFYPHVRKAAKEKLEELGCRAYTNAEFFAKLGEILKLAAA